MHSESLANLKEWRPNPVSGEKAPESVAEHIKQTLAMMDRYNIVLGLASGDLESVEQLRQAAPDRIWAGPSYGIPGLDIEKLRALYKSGRLRIRGEVCAQNDGLSPAPRDFYACRLSRSQSITRHRANKAMEPSGGCRLSELGAWNGGSI